MLTSAEKQKLSKQVNELDGRLTQLFDVLGDPNRFKLFVLLLEAKQDICVSDFADILGISIPAASQQLKQLELAGLIRKNRMGQTTCYEVAENDDNVKSVVRSMRKAFSLVTA